MVLRAHNWFLFTVISVLLMVGAAAFAVWKVDPYFHYRAPDVRRFQYTLDNQRCQNRGIVRHFDYQALITGSSMVENCRASDVERLWGLKTVKVPFSGASYKELCRLVCEANACKTNLELVIVGLDLNKLAYGKDWMRTDLGTFPEYLYDDDPWNDIRYLLNGDAIAKAMRALSPFRCGGVTSFDAYSAWHDEKTRYGKKAVLGDERYSSARPLKIQPFTDADRRLVRENFEANVLPMIRSSKRILFFLTPYSMVRFYHWELSGDLSVRQMESLREFIGLVLSEPKARLFLFGDRMDLVADLANYRDQDHYGPWVNTQILEWMRRGEGELTKANYRERLESLRKAYASFDYRFLFEGGERK